MGIRFFCPHCDGKLNVKAFLAGKRGVCPKCGGSIEIPETSDERLVAARAARKTSAVESPPPARVSESGRSPSTESPSLQAQPAPPQPSRDKAVVGPSSLGDERLASRHGRGSSSTGPGSVAPADPKEDRTQSQSPAAAAETAGRNGSGLDSGHPAGVVPAPPVTVSSAASSLPDGTNADPLVAVLRELPNAMWYVRPPTGGQYGPARGELVKKWVDEGRVTPDSYVWREGWPQWKLASDALPGLRSTIASPPQPVVGHVAVGSGPTAVTVASTLARYQQRRRTRQSLWMASIVILSMVAIALIITLIYVVRR